MILRDTKIKSGLNDEKRKETLAETNKIICRKAILIQQK